MYGKAEARAKEGSDASEPSTPTPVRAPNDPPIQPHLQRRGTRLQPALLADGRLLRAAAVVPEHVQLHLKAEAQQTTSGSSDNTARMPEARALVRHTRPKSKL